MNFSVKHLLQIHSTRAMNEPYTTIKAKVLVTNSVECGLLISMVWRPVDCGDVLQTTPKGDF
jgi:hypothetical protein